MPQRKNIVGDLGTSKIASDSYDVDNIYLTEEGWVYRHYKNTDQTRWWDEVIVSGEVVKAENEACQETNLPKLGTVAAPNFESGGDGFYDWMYSEHQVTGTPGTYTTKTQTIGGGVPTLDSTPGPAPTTLGTVTVSGSSSVTSGGTSAYTGSISGTDQNPTFTVSADGGATVSGNNVTFPEGPANVTVTVTATSATATDSPATGTLSVTVEAPTLGTVSVSGADTVAPNATSAYTGSIDGNATDASFAVSADGGATVSGNNVTFPEGPASVTVTVTATSATASDSPATGTKVVAVEAPTLGTVTVSGSSTVASEATSTYTGSISGNAPNEVITISADGGATVSGNDVTFPEGPASVTVTATATSTTASDSPATGTLSVTVEAPPAPPAPADVELELTGADGTNSYTSAGGANASVSIQAGGTLTIINDTGGHPVTVRVADEGATVSTGTLTGAPANDGESLTWDTTGVTPGTYYYQCTTHPTMIGEITVTA